MKEFPRHYYLDVYREITTYSNAFEFCSIALDVILSYGFVLIINNITWTVYLINLDDNSNV